MSDQWPEDGSYPWIHAERAAVRIEWHDHLFVLSPRQAERLKERLGGEAQRARLQEESRDHPRTAADETNA